MNKSKIFSFFQSKDLKKKFIKTKIICQTIFKIEITVSLFICLSTLVLFRSSLSLSYCRCTSQKNNFEYNIIFWCFFPAIFPFHSYANVDLQ